MDKEFEYYRIHRKKDDTIPLLDPDTGCPKYLYKKEPIENPEPLLFKLGKPIPKKPKMADYFSSPESVISKKIFELLSPLNIEGIQLLPAIIKGKDDYIFSDFWAIHIYHRLQCIDLANSDCTIDEISIEKANKIVLDKKILQSIPLNKRLIFRLKEDRAYKLFHISIVNAIMAINPDGLRFTNIEEWNNKSLFN